MGKKKEKKEEVAGKQVIAPDDPNLYLSPRDLVDRWRCSPSSVYRIVKQAGFTKICLGEGKNGIVRYLREEVDAYEASRRVQA